MTIQRRATKLMENETEDIYSEVDMNNLKSQNYHEALMGLCNRMSMRGIINFIHYDHYGELLVEIKNINDYYKKGFYSPNIDYKTSRIFLVHREDIKE